MRKRRDQDEEVLCAPGVMGAFHSPWVQGSRGAGWAYGAQRSHQIGREGKPLRQGTGEEGSVPEPGEMKAPAGGKQPLERNKFEGKDSGYLELARPASTLL